jgi:DNA-binding PadR family transcriptional regulator
MIPRSILTTSILFGIIEFEGHKNFDRCLNVWADFMTKNSKTPKLDDLLPLRPVEFLVLLVLADDERHGYGIVQDIAERTDGKMKLLPGNLYAVLRRLLESGLLTESSRRPAEDLEDQRRRYYRITRMGEKVLAADAERMKSLVQQVEARDLLKANAR